VTPFRFPIPTDCVEMFRHPERSHVFGRVARLGDETVAADGVCAIRVDRGHWQPDYYPDASRAFLDRFSGIPWHQAPAYPSPDWRDLDDERGRIAALADGKKVGVGLAVFSSTHLRRIARLPRCQIVPPLTWDAHLFFHFNGGCGIIANRRWCAPALSLFLPRRTHYDGTPVARGPMPTFALPNWPPPEPTEQP